MDLDTFFVITFASNLPLSIYIYVPACPIHRFIVQLDAIIWHSPNELQGCICHFSSEEADVILWRSLELSTKIESAVSFQAPRAGRQCPVDRLSVIGRTSSRASISLSQVPFDRDCASQGRHRPH